MYVCTFYYLSVHILKSGIDIGKRMKVGPIKFAKKNKPAIWKYLWSTERILKLNKCKAFKIKP